MTCKSGYSHCHCRDCFEIIVANNDGTFEVCDDCEEAGCEEDEECKVVPLEDEEEE